MKTLKIGVMLLALLLAAMAMVPMVSAGDNNKAISPETAQQAAQTHIRQIASVSPHYADWALGTVQETGVYYDLNGQNAAYQFDVDVNDSYAGYVLVAASRDNYPILEFSQGKIPSVQPKTRQNAEQASISSQKGNALTLGAPELLYLGSTFYYARYPLLDPDGKTTDHVYIDLNDQSILDPKNQSALPATATQKTLAHDSAREREAEAQWDSLLNISPQAATSLSQMVPQAVGSHYIPGVPLFSQPQSNYCAPTSAGMVLSYWDSNGYPNFPDNGVTLINELAGAMLTTTLLGTNIYLVDNGMNSVGSNHGYSSNQLHFEEDNSMTFSEVVSEVISNRPFVLNMLGGGQAYGRNQAYGDHTVAVMGYESYSSGDYVVIQDTWTPLTSISLSYGNWNSALADYSRPR